MCIKLINESAMTKYHDSNENYVMLDLYPTLPLDMKGSWADLVLKNPTANENFLQIMRDGKEYCVSILVNKDSGDVEIAGVTIWNQE